MWIFGFRKPKEIKPINYPVGCGQRFNFMGVRMLASWAGVNLDGLPQIKANYIDNSGVVREIVFYLKDWEALEMEIRRGD